LCPPANHDSNTVSVLLAFRSVRVPHRLAAIMEGESLFNDGTALVLGEVMADGPLAADAVLTVCKQWAQEEVAERKVKQVVLPENGLIALNVPLQPSRLGTLSTRTAHPLFVDRFRDFLDDAGLYDGTIENPFLYQSKTDMLQGLDGKFQDLVQRSVSCAHAGDVRWVGKSGVRHCGYCVPCVYRRAAMIERGWDNADDYAFDVFTDLSSLTTHKQADFRALFGFANRIVVATRAQRDLMVLSHGVFSPEVGKRIGPSPAKDYSPWSEMLLRWAKDYLDKLHRLSSASTKQILGISKLKRRA